jgi:hypothetical protein
MFQNCAVPRIAALRARQSTRGRATTLAEAAAAAAKVKHEWPLSTGTGPAKVITNKDLVDVPAPAAAPTDAGPTGADVKAKADSAPVGTDPKNEAYWRPRLRPLMTQLGTDLATVTPLRSRYTELQEKFATMNTVFQQQLVAPEMFRIQTALKTANDVVAADTLAIDDLEEQGRKAGALPGWFR